MRCIISILFCLFVFECSAQNANFKSYLSNFCHSEFPIVMTDVESYNAIFDIHNDSIRGMTYKVIPENFVESFICKDSFCDSNGGYFRYDYGVFLYTNKDFMTVLVSKLQYEGSTEWDYGLSEIIVISSADLSDNILFCFIPKNRYQETNKSNKLAATARYGLRLTISLGISDPFFSL